MPPHWTNTIEGARVIQGWDNVSQVWNKQLPQHINTMNWLMNRPVSG